MLVVEGKEAFVVHTVLFSREAGFQMVPIVVHWHIDAEGLDEEKNQNDARRQAGEVDGGAEGSLSAHKFSSAKIHSDAGVKTTTRCSGSRSERHVFEMRHPGAKRCNASSDMEVSP